MTRENFYFCSEFISYLLIKSNIYISDKAPELIKPSDLLNIENKELLYEGLASDYNISYNNVVI